MSDTLAHILLILFWFVVIGGPLIMAINDAKNEPDPESMVTEQEQLRRWRDEVVCQLPKEKK